MGCLFLECGSSGPSETLIAYLELIDEVIIFFL